jgi:hypothetical protein
MLTAIANGEWLGPSQKKGFSFTHIFYTRPDANVVDATFAMFVNIPPFKDGVRQLEH